KPVPAPERFEAKASSAPLEAKAPGREFAVPAAPRHEDAGEVRNATVALAPPDARATPVPSEAKTPGPEIARSAASGREITADTRKSVPPSPEAKAPAPETAQLATPCLHDAHPICKPVPAPEPFEAKASSAPVEAKAPGREFAVPAAPRREG